jgi:hypothetical protein
MPWLAAVMLVALAGMGAHAQEPQDKPVNQIKLTDTQVKNYIAAQPDLSTVAPKMLKLKEGDSFPPALQAELEGIAKKHGFASFAELDDVAANVSIIMAGLDAKTGVFTDAVDALKKERADVTADAAIAEPDKKRLIEELGEGIKATPPLLYKENIELVKAHRAEIEKALR